MQDLHSCISDIFTGVLSVQIPVQFELSPLYHKKNLQYTGETAQP